MRECKLQLVKTTFPEGLKSKMEIEKKGLINNGNTKKTAKKTKCKNQDIQLIAASGSTFFLLHQMGKSLRVWLNMGVQEVGMPSWDKNLQKIIRHNMHFTIPSWVLE